MKTKDDINTYFTMFKDVTQIKMSCKLQSALSVGQAQSPLGFRLVISQQPLWLYMDLAISWTSLQVFLFLGPLRFPALSVFPVSIHEAIPWNFAASWTFASNSFKLGGLMWQKEHGLWTLADVGLKFDFILCVTLDNFRIISLSVL